MKEESSTKNLVPAPGFAFTMEAMKKCAPLEFAGVLAALPITAWERWAKEATAATAAAAIYRASELGEHPEAMMPASYWKRIGQTFTAADKNAMRAAVKDLLLLILDEHYRSREAWIGKLPPKLREEYRNAKAEGGEN